MYKNIWKYDDWKRADHMSVRKTVGWYLFTHYLVEIEGKDSTALLEYVFPKDVGSIPIGSERYMQLLSEDGRIFDDDVVLRMGENRYWISTLYRKKVIAWLESHKGDWELTIRDITDQWEMYSVQGPNSLAMINDLVETSVDDQKFFTIRANKINGTDVYINRAGYTGEKLGYEVYVPKAQYPEMERAIDSASKLHDGHLVREFAVMTWSLATEAGFFSMRDLWNTTPYDVNLEKGINFDKDFIGKEALLKVREEGPKHEMLGVTIDDVDIHINSAHFGNEGEAVVFGGEVIGRVTKLAYSYTMEKNIALIYVGRGVLKHGDVVTLHGHEAVVCAPRFL